MENQTVNFKQARDFGDILSDTFKFLKFEFKPLITVLLTYVGPFLLITGLLSGWYQSTVYEGFDLRSGDPFEVYGRIFSLKYFLLIISSMVSYTLMMAALYSYIHLYTTQGKDNFTPEDVWRLMGRKFFPILGAVFLVGLMVGIGAIFCIVPGVYLFVIFSLIVPAIVFNDMGFGEAIKRSIFLVKEYFWFTLGIGFVASLIAGVGSYIFLLPQVVLSMFTMFTSIEGGEVSSTYSILLTIFSVIATFGSSLLYSIPYTSMAFHYHSQIEKKESPNLINKIDQINQPEDNDNSGLGY